MESEGIYKVESILNHRFSRRYEFETLWEVWAETSWEPLSSFVMKFKTRPGGFVEETFQRYVHLHNLTEVQRTIDARLRRFEGGGVAEPAAEATSSTTGFHFA